MSDSIKAVVKPKIKGFICTTCHPVGCEKIVENEINFVKDNSKKYQNGPKNVLIIGASQGFGLSSRIVSTFGYNAKTLGIFFEKAPKGKRTGSAGWYKTVAFEKYALEQGIYNKSINGDAFSNEIKQKAVDTIKNEMGKIDLIIYSLAAPRRKDPNSDTIYSSTLKTVGSAYKSKTIDVNKGIISEVTLEAGSDDDVQNTIKVMGGEDWELWINALLENDLISKNAISVAFSYIGPKVTFPIYRAGTIGKAKEHLEMTAKKLDKLLSEKVNGSAYTSINKALVTQASSAIPFIPLYINILYKIMKEKGTHEGTLEQMSRLFSEKLFTNKEIPLDENGRIRIDDLEMQEDVQEKVSTIWEKINTDNLNELSDLEGYREDFLKLFGFGVKDVDYDAEVVINSQIKNIVE